MHYVTTVGILRSSFFFFFQTNDLEVRAMTSDLEEGEISRVRVLGRKGPVEKSEGRGWSTVYVIEKNEIKRNKKKTVYCTNYYV